MIRDVSVDTMRIHKWFYAACTAVWAVVLLICALSRVGILPLGAPLPSSQIIGTFLLLYSVLGLTGLLTGRERLTDRISQIAGACCGVVLVWWIVNWDRAAGPHPLMGTDIFIIALMLVQMFAGLVIGAIEKPEGQTK